MTFDELYTQIITDWCNRLEITVDEAGYDIIVMSKVITAGLFLLVKMIDGIKNNVWVGSMQASKLLEVGQDKIGRGLFLAVKGEYRCTTVAKGVGNIPEGTIFTYEINGQLYKYETTTTVSGVYYVIIRVMIAGTDNALVVSDTPISQQQLTYAENEITVVEITENPVDAETIEEYRV